MALLPKNPRDQKMVAVAVVAFALAALYWNFVWTPRHDELVALEVRLDTLDARNAAARARSVGRPNAARDLADLVERVGRHPGADPQFVRENVLRSMPNGVPA